MENIKITELSNVSSTASSDLILLSTNTASSATSRSMTVNDLQSNIGVPSTATTNDMLIYSGGNWIVSELSYVKARRLTDQIIPQNTWITIIFDTVDDDKLGEYNNSTGIFTADTYGFYQVNGHIKWENLDANKIYYMRLATSDGHIQSKNSFSSNADHLTIPLAHAFELNAGGTVKVEVYQTSTGNETIDGGSSEYNMLSIIKVR